MARTAARQSSDARIRAVRRALWRDGRKRLSIDRRRFGARDAGRFTIVRADGTVAMSGIGDLDELETVVAMHAITCQCDRG